MIDFELLEPIIDKNGYDILMKYRSNTKPIQIKCAESNVTKGWDINKKFFRPANLNDARTILEDPDASHIGLGGGVILIDYKLNENQEVHIRYYYSDYVFLSFFQRSVKTWNVQKDYTDYISYIFDDKKPKFRLPKSLFIEVSVEQLLYFARMLPATDSIKNNDLWTFRYPPVSELSETNDVPIVSKEIEVILSSGEFLKKEIRLKNIFDKGLRNVNINEKLII